MNTDFREQALELIRGAYDLHTHTLPSAFERAMDDFQLVYEASALHMAGVMIKSHYEPTAARAALVNTYSGASAKAYGGIALNWPAGGLNPYAAENALKTGAIIIWMPTRDSENSLSYGDMHGDFFSRPGISIYNSQGTLSNKVYEIFEVVKRYNAALATGHLNARESFELCNAGLDYGIRMILTHPDWSRTIVPVSYQVELARSGVIIEKNWLNIAEGDISSYDMARSIREIGPESVYLATDRGQKGAEHPAEAMVRFIEAMLQNGFDEKEITSMIHTVPEYVISGA